jgi:hypothetical protein
LQPFLPNKAHQRGPSFRFLMKQLLSFVMGALLAGTAQAQTTFSVGPRIGLNVSTIHLSADYGVPSTSRAGFEAGVTSNIQLGHFALQPSVLFSQKGYDSSGSLPSYDSPVSYEEQVRLNYLTMPLNVAFTLGKNGQGLQVFAGPYVGILRGGNYTRQIHAGGYLGGPAFDTEVSGKVKPASIVSDSDNEYSRRFDTGLQAGVGYRLGGLQLQAGYSLGLRNLATQYRAGGYTYNDTAYRNRAWQVSLSYLLGTKS